MSLFKVQTSKEYEVFLDFLGDRIRLKNWQHFAGGLDIEDNATGEYSIFFKWNNNECIFHVATMLPYNPKDKQQVNKLKKKQCSLFIINFHSSWKEKDMLGMI